MLWWNRAPITQTVYIIQLCVRDEEVTNSSFQQIDHIKNKFLTDSSVL